MSYVFNERFTLFFSKAVILLALLLTIILMLIVPIPMPKPFLIVPIATLIIISAVSLTKDYQKFVKNGWFVPNVRKNDDCGRDDEPLVLPEADSENLALKACISYERYGTYDAIKKELNLREDQQVRRLIRKGLRILLKNYHEKREGE